LHRKDGFPGAFAGMLAGFWLLVFAALMFWFGFVFWYHDLPRAANLPGAIAFGALYALAVAGVGVAFGCWMGERERACRSSAESRFHCSSCPASPSGGVLQSARAVAFHAFPSTPGIQGFIKLNQMGASWSESAPVSSLTVARAGLCRLGLVGCRPAGTGTAARECRSTRS
jgi:ABC-2 type transport system permease protein